ncbi:hypothetical protein GCM10010319_59500 [Streptomyces blastmyceticus]|uniref:Uncharacterized protein n=2 Tax=Streptomyces blastmyceticus TaxID=68180 RepID=A0ABP3HKY3_9ACTN
MLTYHQVMTTDLSLLTTAAAKWETAAKDFETVQKTYDSQVRNVAADGSWKGVAADHFLETTKTQTYNQYTAASTEARAIASLLRDAHGQFMELRKKLEDEVKEAEKAGMKVSENGVATFDFARADKALADAARHDPDLHTTEAGYSSRIAGVVQAVDDADQGVKLALQAAVQRTDLFDGFANGFNAKAEGDIEKVEAKEAQELAMKLNSTGHLDAKQLAEMERLFRDNSGNKEFSQTFLTGLGAENTFKFTNKLNELGHGSDKRKGDYLTLDKGLAQSLATATDVPTFKDGGKPLDPGSAEYFSAYKKWLGSSDGKFYKNWMDDLKVAGIKQFGQEGLTDQGRIGEGRSQRVRGYQSLVTMMQKGGNYSTQFLHDLSDDMVAVEKKDKNVWDLYGPFSKKDTSWFAYDPVDRALGIMSKNPGAATAYFDPKAQIFDRDANGGEGTFRKNDRFDYLREKRDWAVMNTMDTKTQWEHPGPDAEAKDSHKGFGNALQAAATGRAPGQRAEGIHPQHSDAQVRVFGEIASKYGEYTKVNQDAMPGNIRENMANTLADYPKDVHEILGKGGNLTTGPQDASIDRKNLAQFIRAASEDGKAFHTIHSSQSLEAAQTVNSMGRDDFLDESTNHHSRKVLESIKENARVFGALDGTRAEVIAAHRDSQIFQNNWNAKINYHLIGAPFTDIPYVGDSLQRYVDVGTSMYANRLNDEATAKSKDELITLYDGGQKELEEMLAKRAEDLRVSVADLKATGGRGQDLLTAVDSSYADGIGRVRRATGEVS